MKGNNELIAEFMKDYYWQIWKKKELGGYKPYLADKFNSKNECQKSIDEFFKDGEINGTSFQMAQYKKEYEPKMITKQYDTSWDCLMPVVEKIENSEINRYKFKCLIGKEECEIFSFVRFSGTKYIKFINTGYPKIKSVYQTVIDFIKWYNLQNKK